MTCIRIEARTPSRRAIAPLSDAAFRLHITAACWCADEVTGMIVPEGIPATLPSAPRGRKLAAVVSELVSSGAWERLESGAYRINGAAFEPEHTPASASPTVSDARREAGRKGAARRWQTDGKAMANGMANGWQTDGKSHGKPDGKTHGSRARSLSDSGSGSSSLSESSSSLSSSSLERGSDLEERAGEQSEMRLRAVPSTQSDASEHARRDASAGTLTEAPATLEITEAIRANCTLAGAREPTPVDVAEMLAHARSTGLRCVDWGARLVVWMQRAKRFSGSARGRPSVQPVDMTAPWMAEDYGVWGSETDPTRKAKAGGGGDG